MGSRINGLALPRAKGPAIGFAFRSSARRFATLSRRLWAAYWDYQLQRATEQLLQRLDDRVLKDIGLSRNEVGSPFGIFPTSRSSEAASAIGR